MQITKLRLFTRQLEETYRFYTGVLQLPLDQKTESEFTVHAGWTQLSFQVSDSEVNPEYHIAFNIPHSRINQSLFWLQSQHLKPIPFQGKEIIEFPNWNARSVYFFDPGGNILEFIGRAELPDEHTEKFHPEQIMCISEIGVPCPVWPANADYLRRYFDLPLYKAYSDEFHPLGNPEGLLITVPEGRNWFLTDIPGIAYPLEVQMKGSRNCEWIYHNFKFSMHTV